MKKYLLAALICTSYVISPTVFSSEPSFPHLKTVGIGEIRTTPDIASINVGINLTRSTAQEAKNTSDTAISALFKRLEKLGIQRQDIESANLSLQPQYTYEKNSPPKLTGYRANRNITIIVRHLSNLNSVLDGALTDGLNQVNRIEFSSSQQKKLKEDARMAAIENAKAKANSLAKGFNVEVANVWQINYVEASAVRPLLMRMAQDSNNIEQSYLDNEITISDQVEVIFALEQ